MFLNLETERYYGLDETGTRMWQVVTAAPTIEDAYAEVLSEFDVEAEQLRQNLSELIGWLVDIACSESILLMWKQIRRISALDARRGDCSWPHPSCCL